MLDLERPSLDCISKTITFTAFKFLGQIWKKKTLLVTFYNICSTDRPINAILVPLHEAKFCKRCPAAYQCPFAYMVEPLPCPSNKYQPNMIKTSCGDSQCKHGESQKMTVSRGQYLILSLPNTICHTRILN